MTLRKIDLAFATAVFEGNSGEATRLARSMGTEGYIEMLERLEAEGVATLYRNRNAPKCQHCGGPLPYRNPVDIDVVVQTDPRTHA